MKSIILSLLLTIVLSSCVSVRFPSEIKVHIQLPENISEEQVDRLIEKIPPSIKQKMIKTRVEISSQSGTTVKEEKTEEHFNKKN